VICVLLSTVNAALMAPNITAVAPVKFLRVITTDVPPAAGPLSESRLVMNGPGHLAGDASYVTGAPHCGMHRWVHAAICSFHRFTFESKELP